jgi:hypothetical protein
MKNDIFLLAKDVENASRDMIFHRDGTLRVCVFRLNEENFKPKPNELQFYADNNGEFLAFETSGYDMEEPGLIIQAIRWYANYMGDPEMEILAEDPRPEFNN